MGAIQRLPLNFVRPELPRLTCDVTYTPPTGATINVTTNFAAFQAAINAASLGDTIVVDSALVMTGKLVLPDKGAGTGWIYVVSSDYASLPGPGVRVSPADAAFMPTLIGADVPVRCMECTGAAHHYRFIGINFKAPTTPISSALIVWGQGNEQFRAQFPHHLVLDRCIVDGDPTIGGVRGVSLNAPYSAVIESYLDNWFSDVQDAQAILVYNNPGPFLVRNNYQVGSGENMMLGGADSTRPENVPTDGIIIGNHFFKPLTWVGTARVVKNIFESKCCNRVLFMGNVLENVFPDAQTGYAFNIKSANQDGNAPWSTTQNLTISYNWLKNVSNGMVLAAFGDDLTAGPTQNLLYEHNVVEITRLENGDGRPLMLLGGIWNGIFSHNTNVLLVAGVGGAGEYIEAAPTINVGIYIENNIWPAGDFGFDGPGAAEGTATFNLQCGVRWTFPKNIVIGSANPGNYPAGTLTPANNAAMNFANFAGANYALTLTSPGYQAATDGSNIGANFAAVKQYHDQAIAGIF